MSKHPEAVNQGPTGSLRDSLDVPSLSLESAPCPLVSGPVRPSRHLWSFVVVADVPGNPRRTQNWYRIYPNFAIRVLETAYGAAPTTDSARPSSRAACKAFSTL